MSRLLCSLILAAVLGVNAGIERASSPSEISVGRGPMLHAHNCYPEHGLWSDRIDRALASALSPLAIEQDVAWIPASNGRPGRSVVVHDAPAEGNEPALEQHFFERVRPSMEQALRDDRRDTWPLIVLHLDFKTNEPEHHRFVWQLLTRYQSWLTTAPRVADTQPQPLTPGPLLVLTENGDGQEQVFSEAVPIGSRLLLFGTVPPPVGESSEDPATRAAALVRRPAVELIPFSATNYRRWSNFSWAVVEEGGQARSGAWTTSDERRLGELVKRAHGQHLWIRFYTLNGYRAADGKGWSEGYNFGDQPAVESRWRAAIAAGVDFIATDQYEAFAAILKQHRH